MIYGTIVYKPETLEIVSIQEAHKASKDLKKAIDVALRSEPTLVVDYITYESCKELFENFKVLIVGDEKEVTSFGSYNHMNMCISYSQLPFIIKRLDNFGMGDDDLVCIGGNRLLEAIKLNVDIWYLIDVDKDLDLKVIDNLDPDLININVSITQELKHYSLVPGINNIPLREFADKARKEHSLFDFADRNPTYVEILIEMLESDYREKNREVINTIEDSYSYLIEEMIKFNIVENGFEDNLSILTAGIDSFKEGLDPVIHMLANMYKRTDLSQSDNYEYFKEGLRSILASNPISIYLNKDNNLSKNRKKILDIRIMTYMIYTKSVNV